MAENTKIEWADSSWNPVAGCTHVSPGCDNCYADRIATRFAGSPNYPNGFEVTLHPNRLNLPRKWSKPKRIFVCSMADLFHKDVPDDFIDQVFETMEDTPHHTYMLLTKRPQRMSRILGSLYNSDGESGDVPPNIWIGTSVENQDYTWRLNSLKHHRASVRFVSAEPLLGPLDLREWHDMLDWIIVGGESGSGHRPMDPEWARTIRDHAKGERPAFFMKQMAGKGPIPEDLMIRDFPVTQEHSALAL